MRRAIMLCGLLCVVHGAFSQTVDPILANAKREPKMLAFSRVIGGSGWDTVGAAAVDKNGYIYISGGTTSPDFPITPGASSAPMGCRFNETTSKVECTGATFVMKLSPDAADIIYSATFALGDPWTMAAAPDGSVYVAGQTYYPERFAATSAAYRSTCTALRCAWLGKINPTGSATEFATFFAGTAGDVPFQVLVDSEGRPWVTGRVQSTDYPVTPDAFQPKPGFGYADVFLAVFTANGKELIYSTFFGGNGGDGAIGHLLSPTEILFAGGTTSSNFPVTPDAFQKTRTAIDPIDSNGVLAVLNISSGLKYSTYLGGANDDSLQKAVLSPGGTLFFVGGTTSRDFPGAAPDGRATPTVAVVTGSLNPAERQVQARTYPGYFNARILSTDERFAYVDFLKNARSTIAKISLADNTLVSAHQLPDLTAQQSGYALAPNGSLVVADNKYINYQQPDQTTDIQVRGFRYMERSFSWEAPPSGAMHLHRGQALTIPITLQDVGAGVTATVKIRCAQVPADLECSVTPTHVQLEDAATISVVVQQRAPIQAGLGIPLGLLLLGLLSTRRGRPLLVASLGLVLMSCSAIPQAPQHRSLNLVAESENQSATTSLHFTVE